APTAGRFSSRHTPTTEDARGPRPPPSIRPIGRSPDVVARRPRSPRIPRADTCTSPSRCSGGRGRVSSTRTRWTPARRFTPPCRSSTGIGSAGRAWRRTATWWRSRSRTRTAARRVSGSPFLARWDTFSRSAPERVVVHAAYVLNVATPDETKWSRARDGLAKELERSTALGVGAVCFHPGAATDDDREAAAERIAAAIVHALQGTPGDTR